MDPALIAVPGGFATFPPVYCLINRGKSGFGLRRLRWLNARLVLGRGFLGLYLVAG
jgi:hypothetical protein